MNDYVFWAIMVIAVGFMLYNRFANKADPDQAHRLVESGATLLDVRSPSEFSGGHIDGAINIPVGELAGRLSELPRDRPVVVYCASGNRSGAATKVLLGAGFETVLDLGPMSAW